MLAGDQEVDPREALGADRAVGVASQLVDHRASADPEPRPRDRRLGQAGRVLGGVVVELVAGHDLARAVDTRARGSLPMTATSRSRAPARYALHDGHGCRSGRRSSSAGGSLGGQVRQGHPDRAAEARRLDHQPRVRRSAGERLQLAEHAVGDRARQRAARTSRQSTTGSPSPRQSRLNSALSMPIARRRDARSRCRRGPPPRSSAWTVPSSPNGPWRAMKTTGAGSTSPPAGRAPLRR